MNKFFAIIAFMCVLASSCSTKFKVGAEYKEVTIVYGLLSMSDTAHYVKISKGYFDETQNNLELAKNPDSLYFNNLDVNVEVLNNGNIVQTIPLEKVDLNNEGYVKDPGTFATSPNYAYKFKKTLDPTKIYRLRVKNLSSGKEITGETPVIGNTPAQFKILKPADNAEEMILADPKYPFQFTWRGPSSAVFYDVVLRFKYDQVDINNITDTSFIEKDIPLIRNVLTSSGEISANLTNIDFYRQINSALGDASPTIKRYVDTPDLIILAGGSVLKTYIDVNSAQGGITFDQIKPSYTNLQGENVYGIFSTRGDVSFTDIRFSSTTIDSLMLSSYTKKLNIVGVSKH